MAGQYYTPAPVGNGSLAVNGQLVAVPMFGQYFPSMASAPFYKGNGQGPPTIPVTGVGATSAGSNQAAVAAANPFSLTQSPVWWAIAALVIGIFGLRYIHWRG